MRVAGRLALAFGTVVAPGGCLFQDLQEPPPLELICGTSFAEGNLSASGVDSTDAYLRTVSAWLEESRYLEAEIEAEVTALQADFALPSEVIQAKGLGVAVRELFQQQFNVQVRVQAERPRVAVDARSAFLESAICQRELGCAEVVDPSEVPFRCRGRCSSGPRTLECGANNEARCTFRATEGQCAGECVGYCRYASVDTTDCPGQCRGICQGACSQHADANRDRRLDFGECVGLCVGTCEGACEVSSTTGAECQGTCSGDCVLKGSSLDCTTATSATCEPLGGGEVECAGNCAGDFVAPDVLLRCEASLLCNSRAKADHVLHAEWSPGAVEVVMTANPELNAEQTAKLMFLRVALEQRAPRLIALQERALLLASAGEDLSLGGVGTEVGAFAVLLSTTEFSREAEFKIADCAPAVFEEAAAAASNRMNLLSSALQKVIGAQFGLVSVD